MATITDQEGHVLATVDVQTGAFTWVDRAAAPEFFVEHVERPWLPQMTGGFDGQVYWDGLLERPRETVAWADLVHAVAFNCDLLWLDE